MTTDLVTGPDGLARPAWAATDPLMTGYYDREWGVPVRSERGLYERLTLEAFQSGLAWRTVLAKRPAFRAAFAGFDPEAVAAFTDDDAARLMEDVAIVRNRRKIEAAIVNARATLALRQDPALGPEAARTVEAEEARAGLAVDRLEPLAPGLPVLVWSHRPATTPAPRATAEAPTTSVESTALARELKRRGFRHVGPTTAYALFSAVGLVDLHPVGSHRRGTGAWPA